MSERRTRPIAREHEPDEHRHDEAPPVQARRHQLRPEPSSSVAARRQPRTAVNASVEFLGIKPPRKRGRSQRADAMLLEKLSSPRRKVGRLMAIADTQMSEPERKARQMTDLTKEVNDLIRWRAKHLHAPIQSGEQSSGRKRPKK